MTNDTQKDTETIIMRLGDSWVAGEDVVVERVDPLLDGVRFTVRRLRKEKPDPALD